MLFHEYAERFLAHAGVADVAPFAYIHEGGKRYPLIRARTYGRRSLLITAGFHGDEIAGPLTLMEHFPAIVDHARSRDVGLQVYPCLNPSGFEDCTRYNRSQESPNNDLLRYEITPGNWVGELETGQRFVRWVVHGQGPKETRALAAELETLQPPDAALDIHQDPYLLDPLSYCYTFGDNSVFRPMLEATQRVLPIARNYQVDDDVFSDGDGLIQLHDGSVTDYFHRKGVPYTAALETTTAAPLDVCHEVDLIWIKGFIDLAASR
jgi:predicted deacylase